MYEEGISQYLDAKRTAAKRLLGGGGAKALRYRPKDLPSNGEISSELAKLVELYEDDQAERLLAMRKAAVAFMADLDPFNPRLIGSVSTGRVRKGSDIDLHVFTDSLEELEAHLQELGWCYTKELVAVRRGNQIVEYTHIHIEAEFPVELSVYPASDLRVVTRSSTDLKPIKRLKINEVECLIDAGDDAPDFLS